jgi:serine/threonine protein kinase/class 3 adenylate cyclase
LRCVSCEHENPAVAKFCQECGQSLRTRCSSCGTELPPQVKFCHECGQKTSAAEAPQPTAPTRQDPARLASGRYELRRFVGEGTTKRVHLAYDERLAREVAVALIKTDGLDESKRLRVQREAQAMASLGDHPNIVTVHDIAEEDGHLFIVSQFMPGGDLESRLQSAGSEEGKTRRLPQGEAVEIGLQLSGALAHAHERGIVHRDVKPGNIWLAQDGTVKLGDFGLAVSVDRTRLTQEGMMVGTVAYMAPEQALGRAPDVRSDLYALGAVLYEMLTGKPPFLGDDAVAIISQHIHTQPVAPTWHNKEISPRLEALVTQLLEKDPERRPASAADTAKALRNATSVSAEEARPVEPDEANPLDRLSSGVFVGREDQLERLRHGVDDALSGRGGVLLLVGEPGIGKTRTSDELVTYARMRGAQAIWGLCYEGEGAPPYWPWMQIIRAYAQEQDPKQLMSQMGPGAADIADIVSEVRERLPGLPESPKLAPEQARFRLFDSIASFLKNASQEQPLVLVLDDLHWADQPSLLLLQFLAREIESSRILVLGTYRDVELGRKHPLEQTLAELARMNTGDRVLLRGLSDADVARFVELSAGRTPPPALVEAVYRETEGNPFFVHEVVRLLQSDGRLENPEKVASWSVEIPQGVRQVVGRRLDGLDEDCNRILTVASIIGREFDARILADAAELSEDRTLELLETAEDARIIGEMERAPGRYRFSHALIRETLYDEVRTTRRVRLHRRIGEVLEERHREHPEQHLAELAYHFCEAAPGGDLDKAIAYAQRAARRAIQSLAFEEGADHLERALSALEAADTPDRQLRCELLLERGDALYACNRSAESLAAAQEGMEEARALGSPLHLALAAISRFREIVANDPERRSAIENTLEVIGDEYPMLRGRLLVRLANALIWEGEIEAGRERSREAWELLQNADDMKAVAEGASSYQTVVLGPHDLEGRLTLARENLRRAEAAGDVEAIAQIRAGMGFAAFARSDFGSYYENAEQLLELSLKHRLYHAAFAVRFQALGALHSGDLDESRRLIWESKNVAERFAMSWSQEVFLAQIFHKRRIEGRVAETVDVLKAGIAGQPNTVMVWRGNLAAAYADLGDVAGARELLETAFAEDVQTTSTVNRGIDELSMWSDACVTAEDTRIGARIYEELLPHASLSLQVTSCFPAGTAARALGNLAALLGRHGDAERHFEAGIEIERGTGADGWLPRTQCDYARMLLQRGASGDGPRALRLLDEAMETAGRLGLKGWLDRCIETKLAAQGVDSGSTSATGTIDAVVSSIGRRSLDLRHHAADDGTITLLFSDIVDFTPMTERLGDLRAREVVRYHNRIVREQTEAVNGSVVEMQGDAFFLTFQTPAQGLRCAIGIQRALATYNDRADDPVRVRIGLHTGEALRDQERFFGISVILGARICAQGTGEQILVSDAMHAALGETAEFAFDGGRTCTLKGISEPRVLYEARWR